MRAKSNLRDKGQGTSHTETKNSKGAKKNEEEFYNKVANRSAQIDHLVNQIPLKSAIQKSKDRHYKKVIKDSVRSINKNESLEEALALLEGAIRDFFLGSEKKDPATKSAVGRTLRGKEATYNKHVDDIEKYATRAEGAKGYRAQVNREKADDAERKAEAANKDLRKTKGEYLDILRKDKGLSNPQAHAVLKRAVGESIQEMLEIVEGLFVKDGRGDLLDDIDTALGSPIKKKIKDIENRITGCKQKRVQEALDLMEEILSETSYERKMELLRKREENAEQANVNAFKDLIKGYVVGVTPEEKAKAEQDFAKSQAKNLEAQGKLNKARRLVQNSGKKKVNEALDLMEEIINELNVFTVGKVNALRRKQADDAIKTTKHYNSATADENGMYYGGSQGSIEDNIKNAADKIRKRDRNEDLSNRYVQRKTNNPSKTIDDVHNLTQKTGEKLLKSGGDTKVLDKSTATAVKEFKKAEDNWAKKNPNKPKTGLVYSKENSASGSMAPKYKTKGLKLDPVK